MQYPILLYMVIVMIVSSEKVHCAGNHFDDDKTSFSSIFLKKATSQTHR